jgi:inner membrane protein
MDPLTQGAIGAALPQATRRTSRHIRIAAGLGFLAGMAADLDTLIRSESDPLLFLEYHRQFTHSLFFIPIGGVLCALVLHWIFEKRAQLSFAQTALFCTLGYATHALLDTATTYGTMLFWPFDQTRYAWSIISIVDPLFTLPVLGLLAWSWIKRRPGPARAALVWAAVYLCFGAYQHMSARDAGYALAQSRGHDPVRLDVKPSFANMLLWKTVYEADGAFYVDAVRIGASPRVFPGERVLKLDLGRDFPWLSGDTRQAKDIERFRAFSGGYAARDPLDANRVIDVRYSFVPNRTAALWGIAVRRDAGTTEHANYVTDRRDAQRRFRELWEMLWAPASKGG